jgi:hypothetical protein
MNETITEATPAPAGGVCTLGRCTLGRGRRRVGRPSVLRSAGRRLRRLPARPLGHLGRLHGGPPMTPVIAGGALLGVAFLLVDPATSVEQGGESFLDELLGGGVA